MLALSSSLLACGELHTIGATTLDDTPDIEKDAALSGVFSLCLSMNWMWRTPSASLEA